MSNKSPKSTIDSRKFLLKIDWIDYSKSDQINIIFSKSIKMGNFSLKTSKVEA